MKNAIIKERMTIGTKITLTTSSIAEKLIDIMKSHIGLKNAVSKRALFYKLFHKSEDEDSLEDWLRWEFVKKGMHLCRVRTKCFISGYRDDGYNYRYFVVNSEEDAQHYIKMLENNIRRMKIMQKRCLKAGVEKWGSLPEWKNRGIIE